MADLNLDVVTLIGRVRDLTVLGDNKSTLGPMLGHMIAAQGLRISPDAHPEAGHFYRSDHFSLSRVGIPAFSVDQGELFEGHDRAWGDAKSKAFVDNDYHNFSDNYHADWTFKGNAKLVRFGLELGWEALTAPKMIEWLPKDEFEAARKASEK